jgi:hypothetical protein
MSRERPYGGQAGVVPTKSAGAADYPGDRNAPVRARWERCEPRPASRSSFAAGRRRAGARCRRGLSKWSRRRSHPNRAHAVSRPRRRGAPDERCIYFGVRFNESSPNHFYPAYLGALQVGALHDGCYTNLLAGKLILRFQGKAELPLKNGAGYWTCSVSLADRVPTFATVPAQEPDSCSSPATYLQQNRAAGSRGYAGGEAEKLQLRKLRPRSGLSSVDVTSSNEASGSSTVRR